LTYTVDYSNNNLICAIAVIYRESTQTLAMQLSQWNEMQFSYCSWPYLVRGTFFGSLDYSEYMHFLLWAVEVTRGTKYAIGAYTFIS